MATATSTEQFAFWASQYATAAESIRQSSKAAVGSPWRTFTRWYDLAAVASLASQLAGISTSTRQNVAGLSAQYVALSVGTTKQRPVRSRTPKTVEVRNGADMLRVYTRPAQSYRMAIATGAEEAAAVETAVQRAEQLIDTDVMLTQRQASQAALEDAGVTHFRRIVRPELARDGSCGLCIVASDRVYKVEDLMPLHDRCNCIVAGIVNGIDPGRSLNEEDLQRLYAAAGSTSGDDLKRVRVKVNEHGELGPVLTDAKHEFRGKKDVPLAKDPERARRMLAATLPTLHRLEGRAAGGEHVDDPLKFQRDLVARLRGITGDIAA